MDKFGIHICNIYLSIMRKEIWIENKRLLHTTTSTENSINFINKKNECTTAHHPRRN